ncbi:MAG: leucine-rich repeat protein [Coriobacteriales bacterium]|jgi:uncharacterized repeat protein (TIGR02543 family)|nr:leucine-rich repeat protein [Coriobacteriales bacterium]
MGHTHARTRTAPRKDVPQRALACLLAAALALTLGGVPAAYGAEAGQDDALGAGATGGTATGAAPQATGAAPQAFVASGTCGADGDGTGVAWSLEGGVLTISGTGAMADYEWVGSPWYDYRDEIVAVAVGDGVAGIGSYAFSGCTSLASVEVPSASIGDQAFSGCTSLASVEIGDGVAEIGDQAFSGCASLASVAIGESVERIGGEAFADCTSLASVAIPPSVAEIGGRAFENCTSLASVEVADGVERIGGWAFSGCTSLASVAIPPSVAGIGDGAFEGCASLASVSIGDGVAEIGDGAFSGCASLASVSVPPSVAAIGYGAFSGCASLASIEVADGNPAYSSEGGVLFDKGKELLVRYPPGRAAAGYAVPPSVAVIGGGAFEGCTSLASVSIGDGVAGIGYGAFSGCTAALYCEAPSGPAAGWEGGWSIGWSSGWDIGLLGPVFWSPVFVTLDANGGRVDGAVVSRITRSRGTAAGALPVPALGSHTFAGWFTAPSGGAEVTSGTPVTADATWYAHWAPDTYTVTFKGRDDTVLAVRTVPHGSAAVAPAAPKVAGYTFTGWDRAFAGVTADLTVTAQYEKDAAKADDPPPPATHKVVFVGHGGKVLATSDVAHGKAAAAPRSVPAPSGYVFKAWDKKFNSVTSDLTVTAKFELKAYTVKLDPNGGRLAAKAASLTKRHNQALGKLAAKPTRTGYTFQGWFASKASNAKKADARTKVTRNLTYYAHWKANGPVVTLNANGGKVGKAATASVVKKKGAALGRLATPTRTGYTFQGWFTGKVKGTKVTAKTAVAKSVTYYAHWKAKTYTVKLAANGGKLGKASTSTLKRPHNAKFGKLPVPTRTGYTFQGWFTGKVKGTKVVSTTKVTRPVTLYAHWKRAQ